ncbi:MAG TPA: DUF4157 domain-containing protein [Thermoanaerobaculia bacterium]|nr:DUF4157 domain-containing protein [Thermoanaerobaculia bacterium]
MSNPASNLPDEHFNAALRDLIATSGARITVGYPGWLRFLLQRDVVAITLGNRIYLHGEVARRATGAIEAILIHELTHVRQFQQLGLPRFLYLYLHEYMELRASGLNAIEAYSNVSFEMEAARAEEEMTR